VKVAPAVIVTAIYRTIPVLLSPLTEQFLARYQSEDECHDEDPQENEEEHLCDLSSIGSNAAIPKRRRNDRDHQKDC
jgi:hypothetical protein